MIHFVMCLTIGRRQSEIKRSLVLFSLGKIKTCLLRVLFFLFEESGVTLLARGEWHAECSRRRLPRHRRAAGAFSALAQQTPTPQPRCTRTADSHAAAARPERSGHSSPCPSLELPLCPFFGSPALGCFPPTPCTSHTLLPQLNGLKHRNLAFLRSPISPQPHIDLIQPASVATAFPCVCNCTSQIFPAEAVWYGVVQAPTNKAWRERHSVQDVLTWHR
jgi:hypothetical protein